MDIPAKETMQQFLHEVISWGGSYYLEEGTKHQGRSRTIIGCRVVFVGAGSPAPTPYVYADCSYISECRVGLGELGIRSMRRHFLKG